MSSKPEIKIMPKAIVCDDANLSGDITVASGCVIHPGATIIAEAGPIIIGENCIVEEYATIVHKKSPEDASTSDKPAVFVIGANNVFEVGCVVEAAKIGEKNVFECKSYVSNNVKVASGCVIGAGCRLEAVYDLPDNTVIYGKECLQRDVMEKQGSQTLQLDFLRKIMPNYHHLRKATFDPKKIRGQV